MPARFQGFAAKIAICTAICAVAGGLITTSATARSASFAVYNGPTVVAGVTIGDAGSAQPKPPAQTGTSEARAPLPMTGLTVGLLGGAGMLLIGVGFAVRRATHRFG